jgi:hypothetical protein
MNDDIGFYAAPGPMTVLDGYEAALSGMPADPAGIAAAVQGTVIHTFWAQSYGVEVPVERAEEIQTRGAAGMVDRILQMDGRPLVERREPANRFVGNCRHFSTLTVALLRRAGIPSRARCGFANYFEPGKWVDHWVAEYWDGQRWVMLDAQIDDLQRRATGMTADPGDLPEGMFLPGGAAWLLCEAGEEDGDRFGILDMWGQWFIVGNVARDLASLNKVEMLPWDSWGKLEGDIITEVAALTMSGDTDAIRSRYESDSALRVPSRVMSLATLQGPQEVDVPELSEL